MSQNENSNDENSNNSNADNSNADKIEDLEESLLKTMDSEEKEEFLEDKIEDLEEKKYLKMVWIALYVSFWLLSCVLLYTYNSKRSANIEYNRVMTQINTNKLNEQIQKYDGKCKEYLSKAYPSKMMNEDNEIDTSGLSKIKKEMYNELIKTIEVYDKCNYIKMNTDGSPFPISEIMISSVLLLLILSIIIVSNLTNNPFSKTTFDKEIKEIEEMITTNIENGVELDKDMQDKLNMLIKEKEQKQKIPVTGIPEETKPDGTEQKGGSTSQNNDTKNLHQTLAMLQNREIEIATRISMLKSNATFNYTSIAFCIVIFSFYISYKMIMNSIHFNDNLFSGSAFMKSRCYSSK